MAINGDNHGKTDGGLGSGNSNRKNCDHHAGWRLRLRTKTPECDKIQVCGRQHDFNSNENENTVAATQRREQSNGKQCGRNNENDFESGSHGRGSYSSKKSYIVKKAWWLRRCNDVTFVTVSPSLFLFHNENQRANQCGSQQKPDAL